MKIMMTGNRDKDLCAAIVRKLEAQDHQCFCYSRANGFDFEKDSSGVIKRLVDEAADKDVFVNLYANYFL